MGFDTCSNCQRNSAELGVKMKVCGRCKTVVFCSKECQLEGWKRHHKIDCKVFADSRSEVDRLKEEYTRRTGDKIEKEDDPTYQMKDFRQWATEVRCTYVSTAALR